MGVQEVITTPRSPWENPLVERALRHHLRRYLTFYHVWRPHLSLGKDAPTPRATQPPSAGRIVQIPEVGGLHHHDERRAA